jgi:hypothetical protein
MAFPKEADAAIEVQFNSEPGPTQFGPRGGDVARVAVWVLGPGLERGDIVQGAIDGGQRDLLEDRRRGVDPSPWSERAVRVGGAPGGSPIGLAVDGATELEEVVAEEAQEERQGGE